MPRYFFNVHDGKSELDHEGTELPDLTAARRTALRYAGEILDDRAHRDALGRDWYMEVTDATELILFRFDFHVTDAPVIRSATGKSGA